ncbi:MAG: NAD(P)H-dependent glycerol-3-phosphate dehydrogenase [Candidatus Babeliales bacterium]|jgi:glycerol-3-phosphate dehydrogenase (NAD(P)+)
MDRTVTVLGAGAWGTAVAQLLAHNGFKVVLWCFEEKVASDIKTLGINTMYLPDVLLNPAIEVTTDIAYATGHSRWIFEAIPTTYLRSVLERIKALLTSDHVWVVLSKGIEQETFKLPTQIIDEIVGHDSHKVVLAGPSFASEVIAYKPTAVTLASSDSGVMQQCSLLLAHPTFATHLTDDILGAQVGGAFKNVIALAAGIAQGLGWGDNARAYLLTQGLAEMADLTEFYEGNRATVYGLSGLGDMLLTCTGSVSKNLRAGHMLGSGTTLVQLRAIGMTLPEGINTVQSLHQLAARHELESKIVRAVYGFIFHGQRDTFLQALWHQAK